MMEKLTLSKSYTVGEQTFSAIELRDPRFADYRQIGPVYDLQRGILLRDREAIFAYVDRLVTSPAPGALAALDLADTMALEDHILGFFSKARRSIARSPNSSSDSTGAPPTSTG
ncbi:phage tail assembly protein [Ancylobacter sp. WKF20]|uniref:phage tail assembly protein n=1 Tax=Ancylobacter sp. WKF20 TaxID=3039801 RepID=UPI00243448CB|nr:phage tail assembly protein [Ancylobacter sp. WKF20]WGD31202.1 phage tail assembly protein [Ancylobacter sp. WKF20]